MIIIGSEDFYWILVSRKRFCWVLRILLSNNGSVRSSGSYRVMRIFLSLEGQFGSCCVLMDFRSPDGWTLWLVKGSYWDLVGFHEPKGVLNKSSEFIFLGHQRVPRGSPDTGRWPPGRLLYSRDYKGEFRQSLYIFVRIYPLNSPSHRHV